MHQLLTRPDANVLWQVCPHVSNAPVGFWGTPRSAPAANPRRQWTKHWGSRGLRWLPNDSTLPDGGPVGQLLQLQGRDPLAPPQLVSVPVCKRSFWPLYSAGPSPCVWPPNALVRCLRQANASCGLAPADARFRMSGGGAKLTLWTSLCLWCLSVLWLSPPARAPSYPLPLLVPPLARSLPTPFPSG